MRNRSKAVKKFTSFAKNTFSKFLGFTEFYQSVLCLHLLESTDCPKSKLGAIAVITLTLPTCWYKMEARTETKIPVHAITYIAIIPSQALVIAMQSNACKETYDVTSKNKSSVLNRALPLLDLTNSF